MTLALDDNNYNQLLTFSQQLIIENEEEYQQARHLLLNLISKQDRLPEETAMVKLMATIIKDFDARQPQPEPASPQEVLLHLMSANNMKQADLVGKIGSKGVVSEIVNGKRSIRELHKKDDPIVKWFDKGFPQTTLANGEVD
jgi:HTH-type transcriptional regulator/antitoxin HigA